MNVELYSKHRVLCVDEFGELSYSAGTLYWRERGNTKLKKIASLFERKFMRFLVKSRLVERLLRLEPRFAIPIKPYTYFMSWDGGLYNILVKDQRVEKIHDYGQHMHNPLSATYVHGLNGFPDGLYYGEYWGNSDRDKVDIFCVNDSEKVERVYSFPAGSIRHVHGISVDRPSNRLLICTGDRDEESIIWEAYDGFKTIKPIIGGEQKYRTCMVYKVPQGLLYATDSPTEDNAIILYSEISKKTEQIYQLPGPCIYSLEIPQELNHSVYAFATSVEPDDSATNKRSYLTSKLGPGVKKPETAIILGNLELGFQEIVSLKKDRWPLKLFQYGNIRFSNYQRKEQLWFSPISTKKYDGKTLVASVGSWEKTRPQ